VLGAGGGYDNSTSGIYGGPGGYVYGEIPIGWNELVKPGDELSIIVGEGGQGGMAANALGYGGRGQEQAQRASGGGLSGIWHRDYSLRTNALLIAGGGGAGEGTAKGGPGGGTLASGNGASDDGPDRMTGLPWTVLALAGLWLGRKARLTQGVALAAAILLFFMLPSRLIRMTQLVVPPLHR
jgi:hypothetical protein